MWWTQAILWSDTTGFLGWIELVSLDVNNKASDWWEKHSNCYFRSNYSTFDWESRLVLLKAGIWSRDSILMCFSKVCWFGIILGTDGGVLSSVALAKDAHFQVNLWNSLFWLMAAVPAIFEAQEWHSTSGGLWLPSPLECGELFPFAGGRAMCPFSTTRHLPLDLLDLPLYYHFQRKAIISSTFELNHNPAASMITCTPLSDQNGPSQLISSHIEKSRPIF
jgi:hypothetical protein